MQRLPVVALIALNTFVITQSCHACSSCGCSFNSDWASEGFAVNSGFRFDIRYDFLEQDQLREGTHSVSHSSFSFPNDREIQQHTTTRETLFGLDYSPSSAWGVHVVLPYLDRSHTTIAPGDTSVSSSSTNGIGDLQILGRYQGFSNLRNVGVQFGIKLPTGDYDDNFDKGPQAGNALDRGLQNGTGTTDALVGAYDFGVLAPGLEYFTQTLVSQPLADREGFRPGTSVTTSAGAGYRATELLRPQLQLNYKFEAREVGENADHPNSGGHFIYLTPGITVFASMNMNIYSIVQLPIYQDVNGLQLESHANLSIGARYTF